MTDINDWLEDAKKILAGNALGVERTKVEEDVAPLIETFIALRDGLVWEAGLPDYEARELAGKILLASANG